VFKAYTLTSRAQQAPRVHSAFQEVLRALAAKFSSLAAVITSRSYLPLGGIPLQNVVNFCCPLGRVPAVGGGYNDDSWAPMQHFFLLNK